MVDGTGCSAGSWVVIVEGVDGTSYRARSCIVIVIVDGVGVGVGCGCGCGNRVTDVIECMDVAECIDIVSCITGAACVKAITHVAECIDIVSRSVCDAKCTRVVCAVVSIRATKNIGWTVRVVRVGMIIGNVATVDNIRVTVGYSDRRIE
jgi:hypothetical protein